MMKNTDCSEQLILVIAGTRPEVIKLAPIVKALRETSEYSVFFLSSGQQGELLGQTLQDQGIRPDIEID